MFGPIKSISAEAFPNAEKIAKIISTGSQKCILEEINLTGFNSLELLHIQNRTIVRPNFKPYEEGTQLLVYMKQVKQYNDKLWQKTKQLKYVSDSSQDSLQYKHFFDNFSGYKESQIIIQTENEKITNQQNEKPKSVTIFLKENKILCLTSFRIPHRIKTFLSSDCRISDISMFASQEFPALQTLAITKNLFQKVPKLNTPSIKKILFANNLIQEISQFLKGKYDFLTELDLSYNFIEQKISIQILNLEVLNLSQNNFHEMPHLHTPKLHTLKLMGNQYIKNFSGLIKSQMLNELCNLQIQVEESLQLPEKLVKNWASQVKSFKFKSSNQRNIHIFFGQKWQKLISLEEFRIEGFSTIEEKELMIPKLDAPVLQRLNVRFPSQCDPSIWFTGFPKSLKSIKIDTNWSGEFPALKLPNLVNLDLQMSKIQSVDNLFEGSFPQLLSLELPRQITLLKNRRLDGELKIEQLITEKKVDQPIIQLASLDDYLYGKRMFSENRLLEISLDNKILDNFQFLGFLDFNQLKRISLKVSPFEDRMKKILTKVNFNSRKQSKPIDITINDEFPNDRRINLPKLTQEGHTNIIFIELDDGWRRYFAEKNGKTLVHFTDMRKLTNSSCHISYADNFYKKIKGQGLRRVLNQFRLSKC